MAYGVNHYVYQNIIDPNRPKPAKAPTRAALTAAQKADAIARIKAVAEELAAKEAEAIARVTEEARAARRREVARAANDRYKEKLAADPVLAEARRLSKQASKDKARNIPTAADLVEEAKRVEDQSAKVAAALERIAVRREKRREKERVREAKRREKRQAEKAARLEAAAATVDAELRALIVTEEGLVAFQNYMARSQDCRERYYHAIGKTLSDAEETQKERAVKVRLLAKLRENPTFLDYWKERRELGSFGTVEGKRERHRIKQKALRDKRRDEAKAALVARGPEVEAALLALLVTEEDRHKFDRYMTVAKALANRWRRNKGYKTYEPPDLERAMLRKRERLLEQLRANPRFLDEWDAKYKADRAEHDRRKMERIKANRERYTEYRTKVNRTRRIWRARDQAIVTAAVASESESELFDRLMKIYNDARRKVERGEN